MKYTDLIENMDHNKDDQAVEELLAALLSNKSKLQKNKNNSDKLYKLIDTMMTSVAKAHSLTGQQMHDMWVAKYKQIPDTWIMTQ
jgi:hypothetical protein